MIKVNSKNQLNVNYNQNEDWLTVIYNGVTTKLSFDDKPILAISCEGNYGDYITGKIINFIGNRNSNITILVTENQNSKTAIEVGKAAGAKYILLCSPYFKEGSETVELQCKLVEIQTGKFLGGGMIVNLNKKELPNL
jgi:hypothetical protein